MAEKQATSEPSTGSASTTQNEEAGVVEMCDEPLTPVTSTEEKFSEDPAHHLAGCSFLHHWNAKRSSLLTSDDVYHHLVKTELRKKGKRKVAPILSQVKQQQCEKVAGSLIQNYLSGSRAIFESMKGGAIDNCTCPQARVAVPNVIGTEVAAPDPLPQETVQPSTSAPVGLSSEFGLLAHFKKELEDCGLNLSDSD